MVDSPPPPPKQARVVLRWKLQEQISYSNGRAEPSNLRTCHEEEKEEYEGGEDGCPPGDVLTALGRWKPPGKVFHGANFNPLLLQLHLNAWT